MLKGVYKEFISVKLKNNTLYDEAIFILKRTEEKFNNSQKKSKRTDLLFEANRILCEQGIKKPRKRFKVLKKILFSAFLLLLGGFSGAIITFFILI